MMTPVNLPRHVLQQLKDVPGQGGSTHHAPVGIVLAITSPSLMTPLVLHLLIAKPYDFGYLLSLFHIHELINRQKATKITSKKQSLPNGTFFNKNRRHDPKFPARDIF
jgi:hypothetical protein